MSDSSAAAAATQPAASTTASAPAAPATSAPATATAPAAAASLPAPPNDADAKALSSLPKSEMGADGKPNIRVTFVEPEAQALARALMGDPSKPPIASFPALQEIITRLLRRHVPHRAGAAFLKFRNAELPGLDEAIRTFTGFVQRIEKDDPLQRWRVGGPAAAAPAIPFDFYRDLLPHIIGYALNSCDNVPLTLLETGRESSCALTYSQVRYLLANAFFGNISSVYSPYQKLTITQQDPKNWDFNRLSRMGGTNNGLCNHLLRAVLLC
jgi:hypothetical protein